jgi:hypothetical protein
LVRICILFTEHEREIVSVKPPALVMRVLARVGRMLGYRLPVTGL